MSKKRDWLLILLIICLVMAAIGDLIAAIAGFMML